METIPVTIHLTPAQHALLAKVAKADGHASLEAAILEDLEGHVAMAYEVFGLTEEQTRSRWLSGR